MDLGLSTVSINGRGYRVRVAGSNPSLSGGRQMIPILHVSNSRSLILRVYLYCNVSRRSNSAFSRPASSQEGRHAGPGGDIAKIVEGASFVHVVLVESFWLWR